MNYPPNDNQYKSSGLSYASDMLHLAVNRDDAEGFMRFLPDVGGARAEVLGAGSIPNYCALHGSVACINAVYHDGFKDEWGREYWLEKAKNPVYGPRATSRAAA